MCLPHRRMCIRNSCWKIHKGQKWKQVLPDGDICFFLTGLDCYIFAGSGIVVREQKKVNQSDNKSESV